MSYTVEIAIIGIRGKKKIGWKKIGEYNNRLDAEKKIAEMISKHFKKLHFSTNNIRIIENKPKFNFN